MPEGFFNRTDVVSGFNRSISVKTFQPFKTHCIEPPKQIDRIVHRDAVAFMTLFSSSVPRSAP